MHYVGFREQFWTQPVTTIFISTIVPIPSNRSELNTEANNRAFDVIGLVTFVGRVERVRTKGSSGRRCLYFIYNI